MFFQYSKGRAELTVLKAGVRVAIVASAVMLAAACDGTADRLDADTLSLSTPERIRNVQAIDPAALTALATVNGVEVVLNPVGDGKFSGSLSVPANSVVPVSIQFTEQVDGEALVLATQTQQINTGNADNQVTLRRSAYNFDAHDADGDSVSNIIEREENTNPKDANDAPPMVNVNVVASQPAGVAANNSSNYTVEASIGNSVRMLERAGNEFRGTFFTVDRSPVAVSANFVEDVTGQRLSVASQSYELSSIFDQQTVTFSESGYQLTNRDDDGQSDLAEVVAGTSIFETSGNNMPATDGSDTGSADNGSSGGDIQSDISFTTTFDVPAVIQNAGSVYAEYRVDGQSVGLVRDANSYTANSSIAAGTIAVLEITLLDNFNGGAYVVAQAQKTLSITSNQQLVQIVESDFNLQLDTDDDGVVNYVEREQGGNPLSADTNPDNTGDSDTDDTDTDDTGPDDTDDTDPDNSGDTVSCTVSDVPAQVIAPGGTATQSVTGFVDCGGDSYELTASEYQFSWDSSDNSMQWVLPSTAVPGSQLSFSVDVHNPADSTEVYASFQVNTTVGASDTECNVTTSSSEFSAVRDLHVQGTEVFNDVQLRVDSNDRLTLLAFAVPADTTVTGNATLAITLGNDEGTGTVEVSQLDSFQWAETDSELQIPQTAVTLGSLSNNWLSGQQYLFSLTDLKQENTGEVTLMLSQFGGDDIAFLARESGTAAVLAVEFTSEDCSSQDVQ